MTNGLVAQLLTCLFIVLLVIHSQTSFKYFSQLVFLNLRILPKIPSSGSFRERNAGWNTQIHLIR